MALIRNSILAAVLASLTAPAVAGEVNIGAKFLGPLKAGQFEFGHRKALTYYQADQNVCKVTVILAETYDESKDQTDTSIRFKTPVPAGTSTRVETGECPALALWCSPTAATLFVQTVERVAYVAPAQ